MYFFRLIIINNMGGGKIDILTVLIFYRSFTPFVMITFVLFKIRAFCINQVMRSHVLPPYYIYSSQSIEMEHP